MYAVTLRTISWISYTPRVLELFGHHSLRTLGTRSVIDSRADGRMVPFAFVQSPKSGFLITSLRFRKMDWVFASHSPDLDIIRKKKTKTKKQAAPSSTPQLIPLHVLTGCTCKIVGFENGEGKAVKDNFTFLLLRKYFVKKKLLISWSSTNSTNSEF